ncbi:MAG: PAS domain S-box protein [Fimbriimonas sp.]
MAKYKLSKQEQQVLLLTMAGHADKDVAERLGIQIDTVRVYWKRIRAKTAKATRAEVIALMASESTHEELEAAQRENEILLSEIVRRRGVEEELAIYREVFSRTCVGLAVDGGDGTALLRLNEAFAEIHRYTPDELLGRPMEMLFPATERKSAAKLKKKADEVGQALLSERHVRKDGTTFPVLKQVTSVSGGKSRVRFRIYTIIDLDQVQTWRQFIEGRP